jgi:hypothetical protein
VKAIASAVGLICTLARPMCAQSAAPSVGVGFGVDTTIADVRDVVKLMRAYLAKPDSSAQSSGLWSASDGLFRRAGDVSGAQAYQGFPATIVGIVPATAGDSVYVVKILHASANARSRQVSPLALQRLYAVREAGARFGFGLSNALPRLTTTWARRSTGRLTFWYAPTQVPDKARADHAARFVDSVATLFHVRPPAHLDVYVAQSMDEVQRAVGLDFVVDASGPGEGRGGRTLRGGIVLVGDGSIGEAYLHEFVHAVLNPSIHGRTYLWGEGVATWLGGSRGRSPREMYAILRQYQESHPSVGLRQVLQQQAESGGKVETDVVYASGAVIADAVYRRQGVNGLRALALLPDAVAVLGVLPGYLGLRGSDDITINQWWRGEAARASR